MGVIRLEPFTSLASFRRNWPTVAYGVESANFGAFGRRGGGGWRGNYNVNTYIRIEHPFAAVDTAIAGMAMKLDAVGSLSNYMLMGFYNANQTNYMIGLYLAGQTLTARWYGGQLGTQSASLPLAAWNHIEIKVYSHDTAGRFIAKLNGNSIIDYTGDTKYSATYPLLGSFYLQTPQQQAAGGCSIDDLYLIDNTGTVANDFLGDVSVLDLPPTAISADAGHNGWTPSTGAAWECVDEADLSTTDYARSAGTGTIQTFQFADLPAWAGSVRAAQLQADIGKTAAQVRKAQFVQRIGTTDTNSSDLYLPEGAGRFEQDISLNPNTAAAWANASDFNGAEFGVKEVS